MTARCRCRGLHGDAPLHQRPAAAYRIYAMPCLSRACEGRICLGHPACPECVAAIRADRTMWTETGEPCELVMVHGENR